MNKKTTLGLGVIVVIALAIYFANSSGSKSNNQTIKVSAYFPSEKVGTSTASNPLNGAKLAAKEINAAGGIAGKKIEIVETKSAVEAYKNPFVLTEWNDTSKPGVMEIARQDSLTLIVSGSEIGATSAGKNVYRVWASDAIPVHTLVEYASLEKKYKNITIVSDKSQWGKSIVTAFTMYASTTKMKLTEFAPSDIANIKSSKSDALLLAIDPILPAAKFVEDVRTAGVKQPILYPRDITYTEFLYNVPIISLKDVIYTMYQPPTPLFTSAYMKEYGIGPGLYADTSYDAVNMIAAAMKSASSTDPVNVASSFGPYLGASGSIVFNADRERSQVNVGLLTFDGVTPIAHGI